MLLLSILNSLKSFNIRARPMIKKPYMSAKNKAARFASHGEELMVWGCFCGGKVEKLRRIHGIMRGTDYISILVDSLIPSFEIAWDWMRTRRFVIHAKQ